MTCALLGRFLRLGLSHVHFVLLGITPLHPVQRFAPVAILVTTHSLRDLPRVLSALLDRSPPLQLPLVLIAPLVIIPLQMDRARAPLADPELSA